MAIGKNKRIVSKGKKGGKKKVIDPFQKKEWYTVKAPSSFSVNQFGHTLVTKSAGTKLASEGLKGRVFEVNLADLSNVEEQSYRKMKFICEDVQGKTCLTNFHGMSITRDKLYSLIRKWHTLVEANADVMTTDGFLLRMFCIGFTKTKADQIKTTSYAPHSKVKLLRKLMVDKMKEHASTETLSGLVKKFVTEIIGNEIEKGSAQHFPLQNVLIRKVKILKKPHLDHNKFMELHEGFVEDTGAPFLEEEEEHKNLLTASMEES